MHLDSDLLTGLSDTDRKQMVKLRVAEELAGNSFIAYDNGNPIEISLARKSDKIKTTKSDKIKPAKSGKKPVLKELYNKYIGNEVKQESVVLADELIEASSYKNTEKSNYPHDWLDNCGKNNWDKRTVYLQDKEGRVWQATLQIANAADGRKILYDIYPIKMTEGAIISAPTTVNDKVAQSAENVNPPADSQYMAAVENGEKDIRYSISDRSQQQKAAEEARSKLDFGRAADIFDSKKQRFKSMNDWVQQNRISGQKPLEN